MHPLRGKKRQVIKLISNSRGNFYGSIDIVTGFSCILSQCYLKRENEVISKSICWRIQAENTSKHSKQFKKPSKQWIETV